MTLVLYSLYPCCKISPGLDKFGVTADQLDVGHGMSFKEGGRGFRRNANYYSVEEDEMVLTRLRLISRFPDFDFS